MRALCLHGHFYQPPRENPWTGVVDVEPSAGPYHDWNARITADCYAPFAAARVLDTADRVAEQVNLYESTSFDVGPTLAAWLAAHAPEVVAAMAVADRASREAAGHGNAWAQAYGHAILPLSSPRDVQTQVRWGVADFVYRFGRPPEGMWLPEMAVDLPTLRALAAADVTLTFLSPHQARRIRWRGTDRWTPVTAATLDTRRLYRCNLGDGAFVDVAFRDAELSDAIAFGALLKDGATLARRLAAAVEEAGDDGLVNVAVDGETYGHHHRFGEMALAFALRALGEAPGVALVGPAAYRAAHPPELEVEIAEGTSWSCAHGVERWRADCGCRLGGPEASSQAWRAPLRSAIDWLRDALAGVYEQAAGAVLRDPWGARDRWIECLLDPGRTAVFLAAEAGIPLTPAAEERAREALTLARHALLMQTSCGWFFDELDGIEPRLILRHAARALELAAGHGARLEDEFLARLEPAQTSTGESGVVVYRRAREGAG